MAELQQVEKENLSMRIYRQIRRALIDGQYEPGERLRISALAAELGTSITPVREAIFRLVSEQALEIKAATAVYVPVLDPVKVREIQLVRIHLEGAAAERAAELITDAQLKHLEALQAAFIKAASTDAKRASERNRDFHFAILQIADLPVVESIVENMWVLMGPLLHVFHTTMPKRQISGKQHRHYEILTALRAHDPAAAREALQQDIKWGSVLIDWLEAGIAAGEPAAKRR
jgi:DNA-binding GntR family transcriptional regulator